MRKGSSWLLCLWKQGLQPTPEHVDLHWRRRHFALLVHRWRLSLPLAIVIITRPGLVPPTPPRPMHDACRTALYTHHELPEQSPDFSPAQSDRSPRFALKWDKLVLVSPWALFLGVTSVPVLARTTAKNACAHMANVMWRYHPVQLRTS
jgi:hypothetical protein